MKSALSLCVSLFLAAGLVAQTAAAPKTEKKRAAAPITAADVQALKDAIASQQAALTQQQQQIQELRDELRKRDQTVQQAQTAASDAAGKADAAQAQATQQQETVTALKSDVTDLKTNMANTAVTLQKTQKAVSEPPTAIHVKGITITPGGYLAAETIRRSRALAADISTPYNTLTVPGASQSTMSEFFGTGRSSRISMLAEGRLKSAKLTGYVEADFQGVGTSSNNNQTNSYAMRQRQAWGQAAFDNGWSFTGGQMWSLVTETKHGVDNRSEAMPTTIDTNYNVGFTFTRQYGVRLAKNFNNKVWFAVALENAQATGSTHNNAANFLVGSAGAGGGAYNGAVTTCSTNSSGVTTCTPAASYSFNPSPDLIAKLVFEPGFGHYEIFGVYSRFRDRVFPCAEASATYPCGTITSPSPLEAYNTSKNGGGIGANARWTFLDKRFEFGVHGFGGSGTGRYAAGQLPDASVHANGTLDLIKNYNGLATIEWHGPKLDIYLYGGAEYDSRAYDYDQISGKYVGYGSPNFSNSGCFTEALPQNGTGFLPGSPASGTCAADTRFLAEGTAGFWYRLYNGPKGRVQFGPQFSYVDRQAWSGAGGEPHGLDAMIFTSFRYYLP